MATCEGNGDDHCCHLGGHVCRYLAVVGTTGRRFACRLRSELGNWQAVHADPRYLADVKPVLEALPTVDGDCGDWPPPGLTCGTCGVTG